MTENETIISTKNLSFSYGTGEALKSLTMTIPKGKKTVFLGPNGAGKSTLFLALNGVNKPDKGEVLFAGKKVAYDQKSLMGLREKVVLVFQNPDDQIFSATVEDDVAFGPLNLGLSHDEAAKRVEEALSWAGVEDLRERPTQQLSFGQRKRVSLAGALAMKPQVLIMDEPTAGLDNEMVHELLELSDELNHKGLTVVMSTHDIETAYEWADEVRALQKGELVFSGKPEEFFGEDSLIHSLGLVPPMPFLLNKQFSIRSGEKEKPEPRNLIELSEKIFPKRKVAPGKIKISIVGGAVPKSVSHTSSGVYGTTARRLTREGKLDVHYRFHALENAILSASIGKDFTLYTDETLVGLISDKLKDLERRTGLIVEIERD